MASSVKKDEKNSDSKRVVQGNWLDDEWGARLAENDIFNYFFRKLTMCE